jgi:hypothetical protein
LLSSDPTASADLTRLTEQAWDGIVRLIVTDLESLRDPATPTPISLELLAYSIIGALHNTALRASWDDKFSREQLLGAHLWMWLAFSAALGGEIDIDSRFARYQDLIREIAAREPGMPPALED